ncbi:hypothetical protein L873DRAFT_1669581 [Choiromyces venosus 120613-1]|uniref:Uncharacterized protein n=1 Tax=Choiromyces venosus 120613-1 TaxID=1336337 RepID=A0A3N4JZ00_9PEZI|nr:hypothetical protein L873DRAFT_1669581 [Choiromyces venosus 120613-1]
MPGTMFLTIAVPPASGGDGPIEMYASDDEFGGNVLREDGAGLDSAQSDLFVTAKEMLWLLPRVNDVVRNALNRMQKAFAYNSVFFLKVILDLQATYHSLSQPLPADVFLEIDLVLKIAEVLAGRMVRKDRDGVSPSRELQLRTLVSALSLLYQLRIGKLDNSAYAKLLKDISERDHDHQKRHTEDFGERVSNGDVEFLVRYACDLIRCMPSELPKFTEMNSQAIHFLFAAGYINQLEGAITPTALDKIWARITAPPSGWHKDMRHLYEGTAGAISLHHQAQYSNIGRAPQYASSLAIEIAKSIVDKIDLGLMALAPSDGSDSDDEEGVGETEDLPGLETRLLVSGLLDLMGQLVMAFPECDEIVEDAKSLALKLIQTSDKKEFRNKAFEIIISTTAGYTEEEYYNIMRSLDLDIENISQAGILPPTVEDESLRIEELKREKRDAMDRCEKRSFLYKGAVESMQRRLQGIRAARSPSRISQTINEVLHLAPWDEGVRSATSTSIHSSQHSQVPTLSSQAPTCDTNVSRTSTPTCESALSPIGTLLSPTDSTTCKSFSSPTESTCHTLLSLTPRYDSPIESPVLPSLTPPNMTPNIAYPTPTTPHEAITPNLDTTLRFNGLDQLFAGTMFEEPELYDEDFPSEANVGKMDFVLPVQSFDIEDDRSTLPLQIPEEDEEEESETSDSEKSQSMNSRRISVYSQAMVEPPLQSPTSIYPEPSLSRTSSGFTQTHSLKRQSRASKIFSRRPGSFINRDSRRFHSLQLNKPLPCIDRETVLAEEAPEPLLPGQPAQPVRSQSALEIRNEKMDHFRMESASSLSQYPTKYGLSALRPIHCGVEPVPAAANSSIEYESQPVESVFKVQCKDSCFSTFLSSDAKYAVYLSPHSFQVFLIPTPGENVSTKPKCHYRLGSTEGLRKAKVPWTYTAGAASDKYIVVVTKEKVQVHEIENCKVIFTESTTGWENTCVSIAGDKIVVGMSKKIREETQGLIRIYKMNAPTYQGLRCERIRDLHLPLNVRAIPDAPHIISLTQDGNHLACATPKCGYFFAWDISRVRVMDPHLIASGALKVTEGPGAEALSNTILFPDKRHIFCSTFPASTVEAEWGGSFTEPTNISSATPSHRPIRQVGLRVTHSTIAPLGNAAAFLTKSGLIWITPVAYLEGDNNLTTFAALHSKERMQSQQIPASAGKIAFTPEGDRLVAIDRKGKILTLSFRRNCTPIVATKLDVGGYF